jgi:hypothetical protein
MNVWKLAKAAARKGRDTLRSGYYVMYRRLRRPLPGEYQTYSFTRPDRYPWLFEFASARLGSREKLQILSFGCSRGDEVFSLRRYFPTAASTEGEPTSSYDAIFCLAVLVNGDLTTAGAERSDPVFLFERFDRQVADFARCLKPGGLLILHTTNFRFCDTAVAKNFDVALEADPAHLAPDVLFDRDNRLMPGERQRYRAVAFQKR